MTTSEIVTAIIQACAIVIPSIITILTLLKKAYVNKSIETIKLEIKEGFETNENQHKLITSVIQMHTITLSKVIELKNIATRIRLIAKHAILYCGNRSLGMILDKFTLLFIIFVQDITDIGFLNTTREQILAKLSVSRDTSNRFAAGVLPSELIIKWHKHTLPMVQKYLRLVFLIYSDVVNNKNARFLIKSEDLAQSIVRLFILFSAGLNYDLLECPDKTYISGRINEHSLST